MKRHNLFISCKNSALKSGGSAHTECNSLLNLYIKYMKYEDLYTLMSSVGSQKINNLSLDSRLITRKAWNSQQNKRYFHFSKTHRIRNDIQCMSLCFCQTKRSYEGTFKHTINTMVCWHVYGLCGSGHTSIFQTSPLFLKIFPFVLHNKSHE